MAQTVARRAQAAHGAQAIRVMMVATARQQEARKRESVARTILHNGMPEGTKSGFLPALNKASTYHHIPGQKYKKSTTIARHILYIYCYRYNYNAKK